MNMRVAMEFESVSDMARLIEASAELGILDSRMRRPDSTPLECLDISVRVLNGLRSSGVTTVSDLLAMPPWALYQHPILGKKAAEELSVAYAKHKGVVQGECDE